jgi:YD repeat-containing protein
MIEIANRWIVASLDENTGAWLGLRYADAEDSLVHGARWPLELVVDGQAFFGPAEWRRHPTAERSADGLELWFTYDVAGLRVAHRLVLEANAPVLRQAVHISVLAGGLRKLTAIHYYVPGLAVGNPNDCLLQIPGVLLPPDTPYASQARYPLDGSLSQPAGHYLHGWFEQAPDQIPGLIAVENRAQGRIASAWLYSEQATSFPTIDGDGQYLTVGHFHQMAAWLKPGVEVHSTGHGILLTRGSLVDHMAAYRRAAYEDVLSSASDTPAWFETARLLQIGTPHAFTPSGTAAMWLPRLDWVRDLGFNLIQMMPVWSYESNCYALKDHYQIDPRVGTPEELRALVSAAHERGIHVIFDWIPQGIGVHSPFIQQHPDWMVRDELGRLAASHGWGPRAGEPAEVGTYSVDWGHPDYRRFAVEWAMWNVRSFDIDGYRTDAMHWKEANFDLQNPRPAWQTEFGGVRLAEELREELKRCKPDAVLLSEVWGPIFQRGHDATYEDGWLLSRVNRGWLTGEPIMSGGQWTQYLALNTLAYPQGSRRAVFTANHDLWFLAELAHQSPLGDTVTFVHTLSSGFPFVWWEEVTGREALFRDLLRQRAALAGYRCAHSLALPEAPALFTGLWNCAGQRDILAVANLSTQPLRSFVPLQGTAHRPKTVYGSADVRTSRAIGGIVVELPAGGYALLRL